MAGDDGTAKITRPASPRASWSSNSRRQRTSNAGSRITTATSRHWSASSRSSPEARRELGRIEVAGLTQPLHHHRALEIARLDPHHEVACDLIALGSGIDQTEAALAGRGIEQVAERDR